MLWKSSEFHVRRGPDPPETPEGYAKDEKRGWHCAEGYGGRRPRRTTVAHVKHIVLRQISLELKNSEDFLWFRDFNDSFSMKQRCRNVMPFSSGTPSISCVRRALVL